MKFTRIETPVARLVTRIALGAMSVALILTLCGCSSKGEQEVTGKSADNGSSSSSSNPDISVDGSDDQEQESEGLLAVANTDNAQRRGDIVFVHGLGGDRTTWINKNSKFDWPRELGKDLNEFGVWVLYYESAGLDWMGNTMSIENRSENLLNQLRTSNIGDRRICFITHSLGGIVVKQMLQDASDLEIHEYADIGARTKGVVFLGTPNTGSELANLVESLNKLFPAIRANVTAQQLEHNAPVLMRLNKWYRNNVEKMEIETLAFFENKPTSVPGSAGTIRAIVVDQASADPGISGIVAVGVMEDHISIAKPRSRKSLVYKTVKQFIEDKVIPLPDLYDINFEAFSKDFNECRNDDTKLNDFKQKHVSQKVVWDAIIQNVNPDKKTPRYSISVAPDSQPLDWVVASFRPWEFNPDKKAGEKVRISGILHRKTNKMGAILDECKILPPEKTKMRTGD